ncbi:MAG: hypothetical protein LBN30_09780 [Oscillospiraceae bacterium]|jgi:hypothetical protein|nr:hypothetical protein [Oscillospiraceae bacterium]
MSETRKKPLTPYYEAAVLAEPFDFVLSRHREFQFLFCAFIPLAGCLFGLASWGKYIALTAMTLFALLVAARFLAMVIASRKYSALAARDLSERKRPKLNNNNMNTVAFAINSGVVFFTCVSLVLLTSSWLNINAGGGLVTRAPFIAVLLFMHIIGPGAFYRRPLAFLPEFYVSGGWFVKYSGITTARPVDPNGDHDTMSLNVLLYNGETKVGQDRMYREDYEYLCTLIGTHAEQSQA